MVAGRKADIVKALSDAKIEVVSNFESGSFTHGTAIKAKSDVDLMVWTALSQKPTLSSSILARYKTALGGLLAQSVTVSSPVVRVVFWSGPSFEVAPAFYASEKGGTTIYSIAGRRDEWVSSAPSAHNAFVSAQNDRLGKKVKPLVRLLKAWKYHIGVPVSSFYLEMRIAEYAVGEQSILYYIDLPAVLSKLINYEFRDMNDPSGLVGRIPATSSDEKRRLALSHAKTALANVREAEAARAAGNSAGYWIAMTRVFGNDFPWPS